MGGKEIPVTNVGRGQTAFMPFGNGALPLALGKRRGIYAEELDDGNLLVWILREPPGGITQGYYTLVIYCVVK